MLVPSHFIPLAAPGMVGMGLRMLFNPEGPFALKPSLKPSLLRWAWLFMRSCNAGHVERSSPVLRDFHLLSRSLYEAWPGSFDLEKRGMLTLCKQQKTLDEEAEVVRHAVSLGLSARILNAFSGGGQKLSPVESLTDREFEVFQLIGQGLSTQEMADKLHVSTKTIEVHRVNIKTKLGIPTAPELIRFAVRWLESDEGRNSSQK